MAVSREDDLKLVVGEIFSSFDEFQDFLRKYHEQEKQIFVVSNSQSLMNARVRRMKQSFNENLRYYSINYVCKFAGSPDSKAQGFRKSSSCKMGCSAFISVGATSDGQFLEIKKLQSVHNGHEGTEAFFKLLPQNKKLGDEKEKILELLELRCDKKFLQDKLVMEYDKHLSRKDIANLASQGKLKNQDSLVEAVTILEKTYGAEVSVLHDNNVFKALYFSTKEMKKSMSMWPEIVFIDGTYKLLKRNLTLMILLVEDSVGLSKVVGAALLAKEDRVTFEWFLKCFRNDNEAACQKMHCMMGDKDLLERDVLKEIFPNIPIYICLFHVLRTFGRTISREEMNITKQERNLSLEFLDKLAKCLTEAKYNEVYEQFCQLVPTPVQNYFNKNWHPIRGEWTKYSMTRGNLGNFTNNRLESLNAKIKQVVKKHSTMVSFVHSFFKWLNNREREMLNDLGKNFLKKQVSIYDKDSTEQRYMDCLTNYAFSVVVTELRRHKSITINAWDENTKECLIKSHDTTMKVTPRTCECSTRTSMFLPCRHLFAVRTFFRLSLFAPELCAERWKKAYACQSHTGHQLEYSLPPNDTILPRVSVSESISQKPHSNAQKRKILNSLTNDILHTAMLSAYGNFDYKLQVLQEVLNYWREGFEVSITKIDISGAARLGDDDSNGATGYSNSAGADVLESVDCHNSTLHDNKLYGATGHSNSSCAAVAAVQHDMTTLSISPKRNLLLNPNSQSMTMADVKKSLTNMIMPVPTKMRNRFKYADLSCIKQHRKEKRPIEFKLLPDPDKAKAIMSWIGLDKDVITNALSEEYTIRTSDMELRPESMRDSLANEPDVKIDVLKPYFEERAFNLLTATVRRKITLNIWTCVTCNEQIKGKSVICECCLLWYHTKCVSSIKKNKDWFCSNCTKRVDRR